METLILTKEEQAQGQFDGGKIQERKPIGFQHDRGKLRPYGNLFYWAHAWANEDSLIGEHPHQGFEIMSFVLSGNAEHYDSQLKGWKPLQEGDVQIIRAGSGISHAERLSKGASIFQIWFDPGLERTLSKPATYNDYPATAFPLAKSETEDVLEYVGDSNLIAMDSFPLKISRHRYNDGQHNLILGNGAIHSSFILAGRVHIDGRWIEKGDFYRVSESEAYSISTEKAEVFTIKNSDKLSYVSYYEMMEARQRSA